MSAFEAEQLNLPLPQHPVAGAVHSQTGLAIRAGYLRAQVEGMGGTEYVFPCYFLGDLNASPAAARSSNLPRKLLGLSGVIDQIRIEFEGTPAVGAPYGFMVLEKN